MSVWLFHIAVERATLDLMFLKPQCMVSAIVAFMLAGLLGSAAMGEKTGTLRGHITEYETGRPVGVQSITLSHRDTGLVYRGHADRSGFYAFVGLESGRYYMRFVQPGYYDDAAFVIVCPNGTSTFNEVILPRSHQQMFYHEWQFALPNSSVLTGAGYIVDFEDQNLWGTGLTYC